MTERSPYDTGPLPFVNVNTSKAAALSHSPQRAEAMRVKVARYIADTEREGTISDKVEAALGMSHQTCSARVNDLEYVNIIYKTPRSIKTRTGRPARVYVYCDFLRYDEALVSLLLAVDTSRSDDPHNATRRRKLERNLITIPLALRERFGLDESNAYLPRIVALVSDIESGRLKKK